LRRLICWLDGHADPGGHGLVYCPRCGDLFDVTDQRDEELELQTL
jgi:hypothetical protein